MATTFEEALEELQSNDYDTQWSGASFLSKSDDSHASTYLINALLNHTNDRVRVVAALGLARHQGNKVIDALIYALHNDTHIDVRHMSASSLSAFNTDKVVDVLIDALENEPTNLNRMTIAISLGKLKNKRAIPALIKALKTQDHQVTYGVAFALKEFGNLAQPKLKKVYDEYPEKVKTAFNTLWNFMKQFVIQPSRISQELEVSIMSKDQIKVIHAYLPPVKEWDCPICGRNRNQLTWYHLHSKNNQELTGSWAIVCDSCDIQVSEYRTRDY